MMKRALTLAVAALLVTAAQAQAPMKILRFEPNGAGEGLKGNDRDKSKLYTYYKGASQGVSAGVWSSPDFNGKMHRVNNSEYIKILEARSPSRPRTATRRRSRPATPC